MRLRSHLAVWLRKSQATLPSLSALTILTLLLVSAGATTPQQPATTAQQPRPLQREPLQQNVRVERYEIHVSFQPEKGSLRATAAVTLRASEPTEVVEFELGASLELVQLSDEQGRKLAFSRSGRLGSPKLLVRLAEPAAAGQAITLTFVYAGELLPGELDYITKDGLLLRDESRWYPVVDWAAFTENTMTIAVPHGWSAFAAGQLQSSTRAVPATTFTWTTQRPVSSLAVAAIPAQDSVCAPESAEGPTTRQRAPLAACLMGKRAASAKELATRAHDLLGYYAGMFPPAPVPELFLLEGFPGQRGAIGYSAPGFLVIGDDVARYHAYAGWAPEFLPHEIAHQWFPIEVTLASPEDGWLAESLAEYLGWRYLAEKQPAQGRRMVELAMRDALAHEPLRPLRLGLRLIGADDLDAVHAALYQRGLLVWRTLETVIGRARVDAALREYDRRFRGRSASIADFRKICEEISGRDLGWFFTYFLDGTAIPEIELRRLPSTAPGELAGEIHVKNVPEEFTVGVEMRIHTGTGVVDHSLATRGAVTPFAINLAGPASLVTLDPDLRILRWTEPARRHRAQRSPLAQLGELERRGQYARAIALCQQALALDPDDLARNQQQIYFQLARLHHRQGLWGRARDLFGKALERHALEPIDDGFYRAWSRVYRARIARRLGDLATAHREAQAGLALDSPALDTRIRWLEASREQSAREALEALLTPPRPATP